MALEKKKRKEEKRKIKVCWFFYALLGRLELKQGAVVPAQAAAHVRQSLCTAPCCLWPAAPPHIASSRAMSISLSPFYITFTDIRTILFNLVLSQPHNGSVFYNTLHSALRVSERALAARTKSWTRKPELRFWCTFVPTSFVFFFKEVKICEIFYTAYEYPKNAGQFKLWTVFVKSHKNHWDE